MNTTADTTRDATTDKQPKHAHAHAKLVNGLNATLGASTASAFELLKLVAEVVEENHALRKAIARQWQKSDKPHTRVCEECETVFASKRRDARICSAQCRTKRSKRRRESGGET